jgi:hypothetical protein
MVVDRGEETRKVTQRFSELAKVAANYWWNGISNKR